MEAITMTPLSALIICLSVLVVYAAAAWWEEYRKP